MRYYDDTLYHFGVGHLHGGHSGRYPWGSGKEPRQSEKYAKSKTKKSSKIRKIAKAAAIAAGVAGAAGLGYLAYKNLFGGKVSPNNYYFVDPNTGAEFHGLTKKEFNNIVNFWQKSKSRAASGIRETIIPETIIPERILYETVIT